MAKTLLDRAAELVRERMNSKPKALRIAAAKRRLELELRAAGYSRSHACAEVARRFQR